MRKLLIIFFTAICLILGVHPALAHRPHDVISQIEISPNYGQDQTVFIIVRSNLFKSIDGGQNWKRLSKGIDSSGDLSGLALSPANKNILYLSSYNDGIYKSQNGGNSWQKVDEGLDNLNIDSVEVSPSDPNLVFASKTEGGVYKTGDGGIKWSLVLDHKIKVTAMIFSTNNNKIFLGDNKGNLYLSEDQGNNWKLIGSIKDSGKITSLSIASDQTLVIGTEKKGIFKTLDLGKSFSNISEGITDKNIRDIVIINETNKPSNILVSTWYKGFFESTDEGKTWQEFGKGLTKDHQADDFKVPHFTELKVSPNFKEDKVLFLAGFNGLFKSVDSGQNWKEVETLSPGTIVSFALSPNYKNDSTLAVVTYVRNIYRSQDKGKTWKPINKGLEVPRFTEKLENEHIQDPRRFFDVAFSPNYQSDRNLFATVLWNKFLRSTNQGNSWEIVSLPGASGEGIRGMTIVPSPQFASDQTIYLGTQYGLIMRSTDGGKNFSVISKIENHNINEAIGIVISPHFGSDQTLYASGLKGIYKTVDSGKSWKPITQTTPLKDLINIQLAISPNYQLDQTVIAGTNKGVYITKDGGNSWVKFTSDTYDENGYIEGLAISPNYKNDRTFIFSIRGQGLIKTVDGGQTFAKIGDDSILLSKVNNIPSAHRAIQFSPFYAEDKTIYGMGSSTTELYRSTDGGNTWETIIIPPNNADNYDLITQLILILTFSGSRWLKVLIPVTLALLSYLIFRLFKAKEKKHS